MLVYVVCANYTCAYAGIFTDYNQAIALADEIDGFVETEEIEIPVTA